MELACRDAGIATTTRTRCATAAIRSGSQGTASTPVNVKRWAGHSKPSMLTGVYSHVVTDPEGDEWRDFWLDAYDEQTRPNAGRRRAGVVLVWSEEEAAA
jgi:hypothetical protein